MSWPEPQQGLLPADHRGTQALPAFSGRPAQEHNFPKRQWNILKLLVRRIY